MISRLIVLVILRSKMCFYILHFIYVVVKESPSLSDGIFVDKSSARSIILAMVLNKFGSLKPIDCFSANN